jgi:hypothetical protein
MMPNIYVTFKKDGILAIGAIGKNVFSFLSISIYTKHGEDIENGKGIKRTKSALDAQTSNIELR